MAHIAEGIEHGDENRRRDQQAEEQAQRVHFQGDANGIAAGGNTVAHPVGDDVRAQHDGLDQRGQQAERRRRSQKAEDVAQGAVFAEDDNQERAEEIRHNRTDREVLDTHPLSLLICVVSVVPYISRILITRARLMAVVQAPMTMLVSVSA